MTTEIEKAKKGEISKTARAICESALGEMLLHARQEERERIRKELLEKIDDDSGFASAIDWVMWESIKDIINQVCSAGKGDGEPTKEDAMDESEVEKLQGRVRTGDVRPYDTPKSSRTHVSEEGKSSRPLKPKKEEERG